MKPATTAGTWFLTFIATVMFLRFLLRIEVRVADRPIPPWFSLVVSLVTGTLACLIRCEHR